MLKYHPFWGSPLFYSKHPPKQFQPPKCKLTPSKIQISEGRFLCIVSTKAADWRSAIPFWRVSIYILENAKLHLGGGNCFGVLYRKGVTPKQAGTLACRDHDKGQGVPEHHDCRKIAAKCKLQSAQIASPAPLQTCVGDLLYKFWRILPGIFLEDFSAHFFPLK